MRSNGSYTNRRLSDQVDMQHTLLIALVILAGALLRLFMLTNQSLWFDEGQSLVVTDSKTLAGTLYELSTRAGGDKYQPLYFLVLSIWRSIMGDSEFSLRLLSVLPGVVALFFMYAAVSNIYGSRHAFWSTTYLTVSAFWICYSQEVRPYSLLFALSVIQLFLISTVFTVSTSESATPGKTPIALFALVTGLSCFASILLVAFTIALSLAHMSIVRRASDWLKWWVPALIACIPAGVYLMGTPAVGELTVDSTNGLGLPLYKNSLFALYGVLVGHTFGPPLDALREGGNLSQGILQYIWPLSALVLASLVLCIGFVSSQLLPHNRQKSERDAVNRNQFFLVLLISSFVMAMLVAKVSAINWMPRHSFYLTIPVAILLPLAFTLNRLQSNKVFIKRIGQSAQIAFIALLAMNLYATYNYFHKSEYWRDDYRSAARYLASNLTETDRAIMLWGEPRLLSYYGDTSTQDRWEVDPSPVSTVMDGVYSDGGKVFVAINREFTWSRGLPTSENIETQVAEKYNLLSVKRYVNFNIYEFENNSPSTETLLPLSSSVEVKLQAM